MLLMAAFDTETTGLDTQQDRICEIAILVYDLVSRKAIGKFETRCNPQKSIDPKAQAVHGISYAEVAGLPPFADFASRVHAIMSGVALVAGHNVGHFDVPLLAAEFARSGLTFPNIGVMDTITARWATEDGKMPKLGELCWALGVPYDPSQAHGALYDIEVNVQCIFAALDRGFFPELAAMIRANTPAVPVAA